MTKWLLNLEANIIGFSDKIPTKPSMFNILQLEEYVTHIIGDISDYNKLNNTILKFKPDIIIHLAAQTLVKKSYLNPVQTYQTNIMGTVNVLESLKNLGNDSSKEITFLNVTSDKCYENKEQNYKYDETDQLGGYDPYSSSKACSEIVTSAYKRSFFNNSIFKVNISTARAGNVIGGGDWSDDRLVVDCINAMIYKKTISLRNPHALRPWQHVLDALSGYLTIISHMIENDNNNYNDSWNIGPNEYNIVNVEFLVKKLIHYFGSGEYSINESNEFHEAKLLSLNINKIQKIMGWNPLLTFDESIKMTVDWYKKYYFEKENMFEFTDKQIESYYRKHK